MKQGMIYRIGKGNMVKIWEDPWLPRGITRRVSTSRGHIVLTLVSDLIDQESATWDEVLVRGILPAADAEIVLKIPIFEESDDFIAWHYDSKGSFSVKSAYKVHLYSSLRNERAECSGDNLWREEIWMKIWQLACPPKVHHFLWRFCKNSHPMRMRSGT